MIPKINKKQTRFTILQPDKVMLAFSGGNGWGRVALRHGISEV